MAQAYAGILGPLAMLVAVARGLLDGEPAEAVLWIAWWSLVVFAAAGYLLGWIAGRTVEEALSRRITVELAERESTPPDGAGRTA